MLHKAIRQFLEDVDWGELDYLLIDLPPGTGDVSMTLAQLLPQARFVIVTTPAAGGPEGGQARRRDRAALRPRDRGRDREHVAASRRPDGERFTIFGEGGGQELADELDVPLLGKVPLQEELRVAADEGRPLVLEDPDAPAAQALRHAARGLIAATPQELGRAPGSPRGSRSRACPRSPAPLCRWRPRADRRRRRADALASAARMARTLPRITLLIALAAALALPAAASAATRFAAVTEGGRSLTFDSDSPGAIRSAARVTGLSDAEEHLAAITLRLPQGTVYGIGTANRLYVLDPRSGGAAPVTPGLIEFNLRGFNVGFDQRPARDSCGWSTTPIRTTASTRTPGAPSTTTVVAVVEPDVDLHYPKGDPAAGTGPNVSAIAYAPSGGCTGSTPRATRW